MTTHVRSLAEANLLIIQMQKDTKMNYHMTRGGGGGSGSGGGA